MEFSIAAPYDTGIAHQFIFPCLWGQYGAIMMQGGISVPVFTVCQVKAIFPIAFEVCENKYAVSLLGSGHESAAAKDEKGSPFQ